MSCHAIARSVYQPSRVCNWAIPEINGTPPIEELGIPKNCGPFLPWESPPTKMYFLFGMAIERVGNSQKFLFIFLELPWDFSKIVRPDWEIPNYKTLFAIANL